MRNVVECLYPKSLFSLFILYFNVQKRNESMSFKHCFSLLAFISISLLAFSACGDDVAGHGDELSESINKTESSAKGKSSSSLKKSSSSKASSSSSYKSNSSSSYKSSSNVNSSSSSSAGLKMVCSKVGACDAMDKFRMNTWTFVRKDDSGKDVTYKYWTAGKNLVVLFIVDGYLKKTDTLSMYNMESQVGTEMAFDAVKSTCEEGNGNDDIVSACKLDPVEYGVLVDERDGREYRTVKYGNQWWMKQFLKYKDERYGDEISGSSYTWAAAIDSINLYADRQDSMDCSSQLLCSVEAYGKIRGLCPAGWHLPDTTEWTTLFETIGAKRNSRGSWDDVSALEIFQKVIFLTSTPNWGESFVNSIGYSISDTANPYELRYNEKGRIRCVKDDENEKPGWILPKCDSDNEGTVAPKETMRLICKEGVWYVASLLERDTYGEPCSEKNVGKVVKGNINNANWYCCTSNGWQNMEYWSWDVPNDSRMNPNLEYDSIVDKRDGQVYKTRKIEGLTWMAENLNYSDSVKTPSLLARSWCYENVESNCDVGGRLYTWAAAVDSIALEDDENNPQKCDGDTTCVKSVNVRGICPEGWHLPNYNEWDKFHNASGSYKTKNGWDRYYVSGPANAGAGYKVGNGSDGLGFSAIPAGWWSIAKKQFLDAGSEALFWSSSGLDDEKAYYFSVESGSGFIENYHFIGSTAKTNGLSVRCVKD